MSLSKVKIGCDLDGVVAKHSLGGLWVKVRLLKEKFLKKTHAKDYYYPKNFPEKTAWKIINYLRVPEESGLALAREMKSKGVNFFLITGRFNFNYPSTIRWLKKFAVLPLFSEVLVNVNDENPTEFKKRTVFEEKIDFFIDDDLEVLEALCSDKTKLYWVVPGHRNGDENHKNQIETCANLSEALKKIAKDLNLNIA